MSLAQRAWGALLARGCCPIGHPLQVDPLHAGAVVHRAAHKTVLSVLRKRVR
ncbi:hypothetical protein ACSFA0_25530 [Variovorax sp. LT1P1]|uniref:hypothetical protein n=1 Tax=Variovorax sp. LT1P1 TaxID=3443730 RepID=UPI003F47AD8B